MEHIVFEVGFALTLVAGPALLSARLRFSVVPFLILAGMVVGPPMPKLGIVDLWFIQSAPLIEFMGWLGILFLLFYLGLEFSLGRLVKAGRLIVVDGTIYIALNFGLGLGNDDDIGGFAALDTFHGRAGSGERDCELCVRSRARTSARGLP
jgi:K+:H+ antiporter subunit KhtU